MTQGAPEGRQAAAEAATRPQLHQGGLGLLTGQVFEPLQVVRSQSLWWTAPVGLGVQRAGGVSPLEEADDEGEADAEGPSDLAERALVVIDGRRDALSQVGGIGAHGVTSCSATVLPLGSPPSGILSVCNPLVNRCKISLIVICWEGQNPRL